MMKKPLTHLIVAGILFVIAVGAYLLALHSIEGKRTETTNLGTAIAEKTQETERVAKARTALASLTADETAIQSHFVATKEIVAFLETLQTTGKGIGSQVEVVSVSGGKATRDHLLLSLKITGSFDAVLRTVGAIEYSPYDSVLTSLTLDEVPGETKTVWSAAAVFTVGSIAAPTSTPPLPKP